MLNCLYCLFIILPCTSNLLSPGWFPHMLCGQYRYRQWISGSNIIIIVPDSPPGLSLSVARSADFPASEEDCCCSVWAVNNILCSAASHTVIDAHGAVITDSGSLPPDSHQPPLAHGRYTCIMERVRHRWTLVSHLTLPLWHAVSLNPECVFRKSLKMTVGASGGFHLGEAPEFVMLLTGMQNHSCLWCSFKPLKAAVWSVRGGAWRKCDSIHCGSPCLECKENSTGTWKHHHPGSTSVSFFCTMVTSRSPPTPLLS